MKSKQLWRIAASLLVILALVWVATSALARPPAQGPGSEEGSNPALPGSASPAEITRVIGDDPDEDGYTGPIPLNTGASVPSSEPGTGNASSRDQSFSEPQPDEDGYTGTVPPSVESGASASQPDGGNAPNWDQFFSEPQPDEDEYYLSSAGITSPAWSSFYYAFVAGSALHPVDSDTNWNYESYGCVSASTGAGTLFNADLDLPEGSRIDYLRIYYYDTSATYSSSWITTYDGAGGYDDLTDVQSVGNGGYGTELSPYVGDVVDNHDNSYVLNWRANQAGSTMRLCGFRVAYRLPD